MGIRFLFLFLQDFARLNWRKSPSTRGTLQKQIKFVVNNFNYIIYINQYHNYKKEKIYFAFNWTKFVIFSEFPSTHLTLAGSFFAIIILIIMGQRPMIFYSFVHINYLTFIDSIWLYLRNIYQLAHLVFSQSILTWCLVHLKIENGGTTWVYTFKF